MHKKTLPSLRHLSLLSPTLFTCLLSASALSSAHASTAAPMLDFTQEVENKNRLDQTELAGSGELAMATIEPQSVPAPPDEISTEEFARSAVATPGATAIFPLGWEAHVPDGFQWSDFTLKAINTYGTALAAGAKDAESFCPRYNHLNRDQKMNFWGQLISAMTLFESGYKPTSHSRESSMGVDHVTGRHVYSDGLLQLSYQDIEQYKFCNEFDWSRDKKLADSDPRKTIFDPYINLRCGIRILNAQVAHTGLISYRSGQYWATLWPKYVAKIKAVTRKIPYCASK